SAWMNLPTTGFDYVSVLRVFDDGVAPALYAAGQGGHVGTLALNGIGRWDGFHWSALGSGLDNSVLALSVFQDGTDSAPDLYVGGSFNHAGGNIAQRIAAWVGCPPSGASAGVPYCFGDGSGVACPCEPGQAGG